MITFLGDIALLVSGIESKYKPDGDYMANFEYVCIDEPMHPVPGKINLSSSLHDFNSVFGHNPIALCVANNHVLDFGEEGFEKTLSVIEGMGTHPVGNQVLWYNEKTCLLAYSMISGILNGCNIVGFTKEKAESEIRSAKEKGAECIIVNMHWGIENDPQPNNEQIQIGHWLIDEGVDIVIGHHPHCIQPIEEYKKHYIFYSLGNCIFPPFCVDSHFDKFGIPHRKYRFNWRRWNKTS